MVEKQKVQVDLAHKDFYPDFNLQYMWQRTDPAQFRAYYMLSVGVHVPIYRSRKQRPELAQAEADLSRAHAASKSLKRNKSPFELRTEFDTAEKTAELLKIYRDGLLPQTRVEFESGLAAYQNNQTGFSAAPCIRSSMFCIWTKSIGRASPTARRHLARLEELTGLSLRDEGEKQMKTYRTGFLASARRQTSRLPRSSRDCGGITDRPKPATDMAPQTCHFHGTRFDSELDGRSACVMPDAPLVPMQISAQRLQSIGVKTGTVERKIGRR